MGKQQRTMAELLAEAKAIQDEIEQRKADRLAEIEDELKQLGFTAVPIGSRFAEKKSKPASDKPSDESVKEWLKENVAKDGTDKDVLLEKFRTAFPGSRLRTDSPKWADIIKMKGEKVVLK